MTIPEFEAKLEELKAENDKLLRELRVSREELARYWANKDEKLPTLAANFGEVK